jgi:Spy/CpxP family protein refolding chaperone
MSTGKRRIIIQAGMFFILCIVFVLCGLAYAQPGPPPGFNPKESFDQFMTDCTRELKLTKEQESEMRSILQEQFRQQKAYREEMKNSEHKDFRAMKKEMGRIREETDTQLKTVLSEEQMKKFQDLRDEMRENFRKEMRKRRKIE